MRSRSGSAAPAAARVLRVAALILLASPLDLSAQSVGDARDRQRDFELFRQSRIPVEPERPGTSCDARIGRICIWFGGEGERDFPPERTEVGLARDELIQVLARTQESSPDRWVLGQLVHYLVEDGRARLAEQAAHQCGIEQTWWCAALLGYALHVRGDFVQAEAAFREAMATLPKDRREKWVLPRYVFSRDAEKDFEDLDPPERDQRWELFWRLSDPLLLVEGNDRLTDHLARWVEAENLREAENPQGMFWEDDLEETLVRYGRIQGYSRTHSPTSQMGGRRGFQLQDTRRVVGHHHPNSRGYLFPEQFLESPSDIPPESWITAPREARTWYAPPYAPDFRGLETQVGRFRRGEDMLVVGAYRPARSAGGGGGFSGGAPSGPVEAGLFLLPEAGGQVSEVRGSGAEGVFTLRAPPGRYVSSLEVFDPAERRAWRARQGVKQVPLVPGLVAVSDLLILEEGAALPETLDEAIGHVRPGVRVRPGERFAVVWEVYGLQVRDPARVTIGFTRGRPGFLERVGEFLGMIETERPVEITFEDPGADGVQSAFRSIDLELPALEPGEYTLHLRLDLPGREPAITSRPIVVEG